MRPASTAGAKALRLGGCRGGEPFDVFRFSQWDGADWPTVNLSGDDPGKKASIEAAIARRDRLPTDGRIELPRERCAGVLMNASRYTAAGHAGFSRLPVLDSVLSCLPPDSGGNAGSVPLGRSELHEAFRPIRARTMAASHRNEMNRNLHFAILIQTRTDIRRFGNAKFEPGFEDKELSTSSQRVGSAARRYKLAETAAFPAGRLSDNLA
jgi:hypothetical protein